MIDQATIERVAQAIYGVTPERLRGGEQAMRWEHIHPLARERHPVQARAALIAMRNPTENMVREGAASLDYGSAKGGVADGREVLQNILHHIIDAAFKI